MKQFSIRLDNDNYDVLKQISDSNNIAIGKILNFLVKKYLLDNTENFNDIPFIQIQYTKDKNTKIIKISLTDKEYKILKQRQKIHLHSSLSQEVKYYVLNAIYNNKIINQLELNALAITRAEIHKIGININQIAKALNNKENKNFAESFGDNLEALQIKISELKDKINAVIENRKFVIS